VFILGLKVLDLLDHVITLNLLVLSDVDDLFILIIWEGYSLYPLVKSLPNDFLIMDMSSTNDGPQSELQLDLIS
jgi:hypothetical protein